MVARLPLSCIAARGVMAVDSGLKRNADALPALWAAVDAVVRWHAGTLILASTDMPLAVEFGFRSRKPAMDVTNLGDGRYRPRNATGGQIPRVGGGRPPRRITSRCEPRWRTTW